MSRSCDHALTGEDAGTTVSGRRRVGGRERPVPTAAAPREDVLDHEGLRGRSAVREGLPAVRGATLAPSASLEYQVAVTVTPCVTGTQRDSGRRGRMHPSGRRRSRRPRSRAPGCRRRGGDSADEGAAPASRGRRPSPAVMVGVGDVVAPGVPGVMPAVAPAEDRDALCGCGGDGLTEARDHFPAEPSAPARQRCRAGSLSSFPLSSWGSPPWELPRSHCGEGQQSGWAPCLERRPAPPRTAVAARPAVPGRPSCRGAATLVTAVIAPAHMRSMEKPGREQRHQRRRR